MEIGNIYDASQVKPNRLLIWLVLVLPKLYSGYSVRLICLTLLRLGPSFLYVTFFPYENIFKSFIENTYENKKILKFFESYLILYFLSQSKN